MMLPVVRGFPNIVRFDKVSTPSPNCVTVYLFCSSKYKVHMLLNQDLRVSANHVGTDAQMHKLELLYLLGVDRMCIFMCEAIGG